MSKELQRAEKIVRRIHELAAISEVREGITRRYGTDAYLEGANKVLYWMREAGLEARIDAIGNVRGVWRAGEPVAGTPELASDRSELALDRPKPEAKTSDRAAATLVIASHIDTVPNAGRWDGPLGVLAGLDLLENIIGMKQRAPFDIELIAFCDEEGVRYHTTYLGSKVVAGSFERELLDRKDEEGIPLSAAIHRIGGNVAKLEEEAIAPGNWLGYFEIHIEQGPVLDEKKIPAAVVKAIAGQIRAEVVFKGVAGHAGTVPMEMRSDALCGAAEFIVELEKLALAVRHELVATVGKLQVLNPASNVIPGDVVCSVDIRSADGKVLSQAHEKIRGLCAAIGERRRIGVDWKVLQASAPVVCDTGMNELLGRSILEAGYESLQLVSGAGHDAVPVSAVSPVAMLFVRCAKGISHHPLEHVETADIAAVIAISDKFIQQLIATWKYQH
ncbi:MAG TPA: M20 family metallo-hydrolase [Puia sp.]|nr:M20 family metallo-hydrolase [Puia sp.]